MENEKDTLTRLQESMTPFAKLLGIKFLSGASERVTAELTVRADMCTEPAILHGGAMMAFADTLGAHATMLNLSGGASTTTLESKTNFLAPAPMVWQTRLSAENGRLLAVVTQTQMVLEARS